MVKIRLKQQGKKHQKVYRIVVADSLSWRGGKTIDNIGFYDPTKKPSVMEIDKEKLEKWIKNGAQMTDQVKNIYSKKS
jgi:small subunit ribosomal protein S16